jgi:hypothetical protein
MFPDFPILLGIRIPRFPTAYFSFASIGRSIAGRPRSAFILLRLSVLEPKAFAGRSIVSRLYCTPKAMWKLGWFLRDFLYDPELLSQDEVDERALRGLVGVVKISHTVINGVSLVNFDGFAPASQWEELATSVRVPPTSSGKALRKERASR